MNVWGKNAKRTSYGYLVEFRAPCITLHRLGHKARPPMERPPPAGTSACKHESRRKVPTPRRTGAAASVPSTSKMRRCAFRTASSAPESFTSAILLMVPPPFPMIFPTADAATGMHDSDRCVWVENTMANSVPTPSSAGSSSPAAARRRTPIAQRRLFTRQSAVLPGLPPPRLLWASYQCGGVETTGRIVCLEHTKPRILE